MFLFNMTTSTLESRQRGRAVAVANNITIYSVQLADILSP